MIHHERVRAASSLIFVFGAAVTVAKALEAMDYKLAAKNFFDTLEVEAEAAVVQSLALERGINFFYPSEDRRKKGRKI